MKTHTRLALLLALAVAQWACMADHEPASGGDHVLMPAQEAQLATAREEERAGEIAQAQAFDSLAKSERAPAAPSAKPAPEPEPTPTTGEMIANPRDVGIHKALGSTVTANRPLKSAFGDTSEFDGKQRGAMDSVGDALIVGRGFGGMGLKGTGAGGGGEGLPKSALGRAAPAEPATVDLPEEIATEEIFAEDSAADEILVMEEAEEKVAKERSKRAGQEVYRARREAEQARQQALRARDAEKKKPAVTAYDWDFDKDVADRDVADREDANDDARGPGYDLADQKQDDWDGDRRRGARGGRRVSNSNSTLNLDGALYANKPQLGLIANEDSPEIPVGDLSLALDPEPPAEFLPRMCYFENTYLGGSAAYIEQLRRLDASFQRVDVADVVDRPYALASLPAQRFDAPPEQGIHLDATLHTRSLDEPGRVFLQIGLKGSERYGWRRPPLDVMLVVDADALRQQPQSALEAVEALLKRLGAADRLGVIVTGAQGEQIALPLQPQPSLRFSLPRQMESISPGGAGDLAAALDHAGRLLATAAEDQARIPGSQTVILLTGAGEGRRVASAQAAAHRLSLQGAVTSVVEIAPRPSGHWWAVANAGHGNYHLADAPIAEVIDEELETLSRVVARLLRLNIRLGKSAQGVRVLGSRVLAQREVKAVKAREEATDRSLSESLGVTQDRGEDDDGIQTVIPYFYGGDDHVILVELWVERPGHVADITLKYKDMVNLTNATAQTSVRLLTSPKADTPAQRLVQRNIRAFQVAERLAQAGDAAKSSGVGAALQVLADARRLAHSRRDRQIVEAFDTMLRRRDHVGEIADALEMTAKRRMGLAASEVSRGRP